MAEFLVFYISIAVAWFITAVVVSTNDCKELNAMLSRKVYRVDFKACFFKSLFFPLTLVKMLYDLIKNAKK